MVVSSIDKEKEFTDEQVGEWILNKVFNDVAILDVFAGINNVEWYANSNVSLLIGTIIELYKKHKVCPTKDAVIGNIKYLIESKKSDANLDDVISTFNRISSMHIDIDPDTVSESIELFVQNSGMYHAVERYTSNRLLGGVKGKKANFTETLSEIHKFEEFRIDNDIGLDYFSKEGMEKHWDFLTNPVAKLPTGISWIDKITSGGIYRDGHFLGVIAAAPNVGKSIILSNLAFNFLKQNLTVLIVSLEMSEQVYARRITSLVANSCIDTLGSYPSEGMDEQRSFIEQHPNARLIIKEYPTGGATPMTIDSYLENLIHKGIKPNVVILDYLNLLKPSNYHYYGEKQHIQVGYITKEVRGLSSKFKIPFFSATQSNRSGYDNTKVQLSNISQSTAVAEDADFIISAYSFDEDVIQGMVKLEVIKSRLGGRSHPPHQFQIDKETLLLIDRGDAVIDGDDGNEQLTNIIQNSKNSHKDENDCKKYSSPMVETNITVSQTVTSELDSMNPNRKNNDQDTTFSHTMTAAQQELEDELEFGIT